MRQLERRFEMKAKQKVIVRSLVWGSMMLSATAVYAGSDSGNGACSQLPGQAALKAALTTARQVANGGFKLDMWGPLVKKEGGVCGGAVNRPERGFRRPGGPRPFRRKTKNATPFSPPRFR